MCVAVCWLSGVCEKVQRYVSVQIFEKQEVERISTLRNMVWTHLNHLSQQCVTSDEVHTQTHQYIPTAFQFQFLLLQDIVYISEA